ncbi:MAG TPA: tetratricopeptide repeat protein [Acidobacteriota bacterium]
MSRKKKSRSSLPAKGSPRGTMPASWDPWIVLALSLLVYFNTLGNELVWDDQVAIAQNPLVSSMNIRGIFSTAYWYPDPKLTDLYRPVTVLSFALNYTIGGLAPFAYHLTNVILHGINSLLVFLLLTQLTRSRSLSLGAALIFALHPVHSEAVAWVSGRAELLACFFMLSAWWVSLANGSASPDRTSGGAWWLHAGSAAVLYLFALLSKESALVLLPVVWIFRAVSFQSSHAKEPSSLSWKNIVRPIDVALAGAALCMIGLRIAILGQVGPKTADTVPYAENPLAFSSATTRVLTAIKLLGLYFWKMVWPLRLSSDYSFNQIPVATWGDPLFWIALALLLFCLILALRTGLSSWILGGIWATCAGFSTVLNLFFPTGTLFAERLAYFPLLGFSVATAALIDHPRLRRFLSLPGPVLLASVLVVFFVRTYERNRDWKDNPTVFSAMARTAPESAKAQTLAGLSRAEQPSLSRQHFQEALKIYPEYHQAKLGLAQAEINLKNYGKAQELLKEILMQDQNSREALQALAIAYRGSGKFNLELETSDKVLALHPDDPLALTDRAIALEGLKRDSEAIAAFQKAIAAGADSAEIRNRLGTIYLAQKNLQAALEQFVQASRLQPSDPLSYFNLGDVYRQMGDQAGERQAYLDFLRYWRGNPRVAATIRNRLEALH